MGRRARSGKLGTLMPGGTTCFSGGKDGVILEWDLRHISAAQAVQTAPDPHYRDWQFTPDSTAIIAITVGRNSLPWPRMVLTFINCVLAERQPASGFAGTRTPTRLARTVLGGNRRRRGEGESGGEAAMKANREEVQFASALHHP
jgi:hypothetical protein